MNKIRCKTNIIRNIILKKYKKLENISINFNIGDFNNWIIPGLVACGPFPGMDGINYLNKKEVIENFKNLNQLGINTFICLQEEINPNLKLQPHYQIAFPNYLHYFEIPEIKNQNEYLHFPLVDQTFPSEGDFQKNIEKILDILISGKKIFIHCAGGHGRTGIYSAVLIYLLENCSIEEALSRTQVRHDSRKILDKRQKRQVLSPSTKNQFKFVHFFIKSMEKPSFEISVKGEKLYVDGGMSTEITFAKYCAFRAKYVYSGWNIDIRMVYPNIILRSIEYVVNTIKNFETENCQKTVLYSTGFLSAPYITELCNFIYLPSQFLVGFNNISELQEVLKVLSVSNIKAYAIAGFDGCIPNCLVAWIKFIEMPPQYQDLINNYLKSEHLFIAGVYDENFKSTGENIIYKYEESKSENKIFPEDIYFLHIHACYDKGEKGEKVKLNKDWEIFQNLLVDFNRNKVSINKAYYVADWESAIDHIQENLIQNFIGKIYRCSSLDTLSLYDLSYELSKFFIKINRIQVQGIVANPYIMNSPTYESNYGYLAFTYWQSNPTVENRLQKKIDADLPTDGLLWINDQQNQKENWQKIFSKYKIKYINNNNSLCQETSDWIIKYKPTNYSQKNYISPLQLCEIMKKCGIFVK